MAAKKFWSEGNCFGCVLKLFRYSSTRASIPYVVADCNLVATLHLQDPVVEKYCAHDW
jgi:hypothetical protein